MQIDIYEVHDTPEFDKRLNRLTTKKHFKTLPKQVRELFIAFGKGEFEGERIRHAEEPIAYDVYKMRLPNPDINVGKSNGYRVIYMVVTEFRIVVFITIYYKKEEADVSDKYIDGLIDGCILDILPDNEDGAEGTDE